MQSIKYAAPTSVEDAVDVLAEYGDKARVLAGGTDLIVQVREWGRDVGIFVDAKTIPELTELAMDSSEGLTLGAAVPCYQIYGNDAVRESYPGLIDAVSMIGGTAIQGRASVGGNLCNSGPAGDSIPPLIIYSAICNVAGPNGTRQIKVEDFCTGPGRNCLEDNELLVSLSLPAPAKSSGAHYLRFIPRNEMDIAVVDAGANITLDGDSISEARIALGAVAPTPLYLADAGSALVGKPATEDSFKEAASVCREAATPITDMRGTIEYRKHMSGVLAMRALRGALTRARGGDVNVH